MVAFVSPNELLSPSAALLSKFQDVTPASRAVSSGADWRSVSNLYVLDVAQPGTVIIAGAGTSDVANVSLRKNLHSLCGGSRLNGAGGMVQLTSIESGEK